MKCVVSILELPVYQPIATVPNKNAILYPISFISKTATVFLIPVISSPWPPQYQQTFTVVGSESTRQLAPLLGMPDMITEVYQGTHSFPAYNFPLINLKIIWIQKYLVDQGFGGVLVLSERFLLSDSVG